MRPYFLGRDNDREAAPDMTIALDTMACRRLTTCLLCGCRPHDVWYNAWERHEGRPLALAFSLCLSCKAHPDMAQRVDTLLSARYEGL